MRTLDGLAADERERMHQHYAALDEFNAAMAMSRAIRERRRKEASMWLTVILSLMLSAAILSGLVDRLVGG